MHEVALIRGVGGPTAMKMAELRDVLADAGLSVVATLQVAGNVIFRPEGRSRAASSALVTRAIREAFGHELAVLIRDHDDLVRAAARNPFAGSQSGNWLMTIFCDRAADAAGLAANAGGADRFAVDGAEVFVRYDAGVAGSRLQTAWFERKLDVVATARNANTVDKLIALTAA